METPPVARLFLTGRRLWIYAAVDDPETDEASITLELAIPLLEEAAGGRVEGVIGDNDPFVAVTAMLDRERFDEVIVSTLPERVSRWLRRDLPARVEKLGIPVTVVTARTSDRSHGASA